MSTQIPDELNVAAPLSVTPWANVFSPALIVAGVLAARLPAPCGYLGRMIVLSTLDFSAKSTSLFFSRGKGWALGITGFSGIILLLDGPPDPKSRGRGYGIEDDGPPGCPSTGDGVPRAAPYGIHHPEAARQ
ncbi:hypothetical protein CGRA01v4_09062 [Colletotrichum graminicola]|nr:hypothetical protein CGRA01v4_09062 [Colletotrichum graminicola]